MGFELVEVNTVVLTISILVAFSGWAKFLYDISTSRPKINGQIFNVLFGEIDDPENKQVKLTIFLVYLYLTNKRRNNVHILDYELEVDLGSGFEKLERVYGVQNVQNWILLSGMQQIKIPDFTRKLIYSENKPVEYGSPLHGFVLFASRKPQQLYIESVDNGHIHKYKITIIDAFQKKHVIVCSTDKFPNIYLLQDLAGITGLAAMKK